MIDQPGNGKAELGPAERLCGGEGAARIPAAANPQIPTDLLIQPNVLEARAVVDAVDHLGHPLHPWLVADRRARVKEDRSLPGSTSR